MKKIKCLSLLLCLCLLLQCIPHPASATETQSTTEAAETTAAANPSQEAATGAFGTVCVQNGCRTIEGMVPLAGSEKKLDTAQSAFLYEVNTGTVVYSYNPDTKVHPGVLAKIVLAMIVLENCEMDDVVTVTEGIQSYLPASAHTMLPEKLKSNEHMTVGDLLHGVLMINANDAAVALAHHVAGSTTSFLTLMNNWVKQIGCTNTEFGNISGLYTNVSYSTARDMAKIVQEAIKNEDFMEIFGTATYTIPATDLADERSIKTQNYFLDKSVVPDFYDTRVKGGMQSYSEQTGASIVCVATNAVDSGTDDDAEDATESTMEDVTEQSVDETITVKDTSMTFIAVVLGATRVYAANGWSTLSYGNFNEMTDLLKLGFNNYKVNRIVYDGMALSPFTVAGGECNAVGQAVVDIDSVVPSGAQMTNLIMSYSVMGGGLSAPIAKDQLIATMQIKYRECVLAEAEVYSMGAVKASDSTGVTIRSTAGQRSTGGSGFLSVIGTICTIVLGLAAVYLTFNAYMRSRIKARRRKRREARRRNR